MYRFDTEEREMDEFAEKVYKQVISYILGIFIIRYSELQLGP